MKRDLQTILVAAVAMVAIVALLVALFVFLGASVASKERPANARFVGSSETSVSCSMLMDNVTGVYYLVVRDGAGIGVTPVLMPDGTPCRVDNVDPDEVRESVQENQEQWLEEADYE